MPPSISRNRSSRLFRWVAAGCAGMMVALAVFAASPIAHEALHDHGHGHHHADVASEAGCAVDLFAAGIPMPVAPATAMPSTVVVATRSPVGEAEVLLISPRYLRRPERGPPGSWVS